jgi:hypothetical protein
MRQDDLRFLMKDGEAEVVCAISANVLLAIGKAAGMTNPVFAFWGFRDRIEEAASAKSINPHSVYALLRSERTGHPASTSCTLRLRLCRTPCDVWQQHEG